MLRSATLSRPSGTVAEVVARRVVSNPLCQDRRGGMEWVFTQIELFRVDGQGQDGRRSLLFIFAAGSAGIESWERVWVGFV